MEAKNQPLEKIKKKISIFVIINCFLLALFVINLILINPNNEQTNKINLWIYLYLPAIGVVIAILSLFDIHKNKYKEKIFSLIISWIILIPGLLWTVFWLYAAMYLDVGFFSLS